MSMFPKEQLIRFPDVDLCVFEWGKPGGQQVLLVHATGFHARCWDQVVAKLPEDWHIFAVDMRGHGRSSNSEPFTWAQFGDDLIRVSQALGLKDAIGVGHSMGGHCVTHAAGHHAEFFKHLVLVDPVIFSPGRLSRTRRRGVCIGGRASGCASAWPLFLNR
jgi:pimeloyl-ACP methyl ester carboxylesterase